MHKTDNSRKIFKGALTRALAVILCVSMVFGVLGLTGCSLIDDLTNGVAQKSLSEAELAVTVTSEVSDVTAISLLQLNDNGRSPLAPFIVTVATK